MSENGSRQLFKKLAKHYKNASWQNAIVLDNESRQSNVYLKLILENPE